MSTSFDSTHPEASRLSRREFLLAKRALLERQLKAATAKEHAAQRKEEARAKFLLGAAVLSVAEADPQLVHRLSQALSDKDRSVIERVLARRRPAPATSPHT